MIVVLQTPCYLGLDGLNTKISNFGVAISTPLHQGLVLKFSREDQTFKVKIFIIWLFALFWPARGHNGTIMLQNKPIRVSVISVSSTDNN